MMVDGKCGGDEDIEPNIEPTLVPQVGEAPMTRSKTRRLREGFNDVVQTLITTIEHGGFTKNNPEVNLSSDGLNEELLENFVHLSLKEIQPQEKHYKSILLTGNGAQTKKNHSKIIPELEDTLNTSHLAIREQTRSEDDSEANHEEMLKDNSHTNLKGLGEEEFTKGFKLDGPEQAECISAPKPHKPSPNQVFSIYKIYAG